MTWSDIISGILLVVLGWRSLRPNRPVSLWLAAGVGAWLSAAPVIFWAPVAGAYLNDTLVGMLVLALTILIPGMPNMIVFMKMGGATPPGWSYNPRDLVRRRLAGTSTRNVPVGRCPAVPSLDSSAHGL